MKKTIIIITLFLIFLPPLLHVALLLNGKYHSYGRTYQATLDRIGWQMTFTEQNADTILKFTFVNIENNQCDSLSFLTHNGGCGKVIDFTFIEGVDTVFIRKKRELRDLFPPEEQNKYPVTPDGEFYNPIIGDITPGCRSISFSDSSFFSYDRNKCTYVPKSNKIHIVTLSHNTERGNTYYLFDETKDDTIRVQLVLLE